MGKGAFQILTHFVAYQTILRFAEYFHANALHMMTSQFSRLLWKTTQKSGGSLGTVYLEICTVGLLGLAIVPAGSPFYSPVLEAWPLRAVLKWHGEGLLALLMPHPLSKA